MGRLRCPEPFDPAQAMSWACPRGKPVERLDFRAKIFRDQAVGKSRAFESLRWMKALIGAISGPQWLSSSNVRNTVEWIMVRW